jgi:hypothetical protein
MTLEATTHRGYQAGGSAGRARRAVGGKAELGDRWASYARTPRTCRPIGYPVPVGRVVCEHLVSAVILRGGRAGTVFNSPSRLSG